MLAISICKWCWYTNYNCKNLNKFSIYWGNLGNQPQQLALCRDPPDLNMERLVPWTFFQKSFCSWMRGRVFGNLTAVFSSCSHCSFVCIVYNLIWYCWWSYYSTRLPCMAVAKIWLVSQWLGPSSFGMESTAVRCHYIEVYIHITHTIYLQGMDAYTDIIYRYVCREDM